MRRYLGLTIHKSSKRFGLNANDTFVYVELPALALDYEIGKGFCDAEAIATSDGIAIWKTKMITPGFDRLGHSSNATLPKGQGMEVCSARR